MRRPAAARRAAEIEPATMRVGAQRPAPRPRARFAPFDQHIGAVGDGQRGAWRSARPAGWSRRSRGSPELARTPCSTSLGESPAEGSSSISTRGSDHQRAGDRQHLPLAAREPARRQALLPREVGEERVHARRCARRRSRAGRMPARAADSPSTIMLAKTFSVCGTKARPWRTISCAGRPVMSAPSSCTVPADDRHQPGDGLDQRRLAGAVRPEDGDDLAAAIAQARRRARSARRARSRRPGPRCASTGALMRRLRRDRRRSRAGSRATSIGAPSASSRPAAMTTDAAAEARDQVHVVLDDAGR